MTNDEKCFPLFTFKLLSAHPKTIHNKDKKRGKGGFLHHLLAAVVIETKEFGMTYV